MKRFQKIMTIIALPMALLLPVWLTFGRELFGATGGLLSLIMLFASPLLIALLGAIYLLMRFRRDVVESRVFGRVDSVLLLILYIAIFSIGLFAVSGSGSEDGLSSAAQKLGLVSINTSTSLSSFFYILGVNTALVLGVFAVVELFMKREIWGARKVTSSKT